MVSARGSPAASSRRIVTKPTRDGSTTLRTPTRDAACIVLTFADGSLGVVNYLPNGSKAFPKEQLDVMCAGSVFRLDNWRSLTGWGAKGFKTRRSWRQDKGHGDCLRAFLDAVRDGRPAPVSYEALRDTSQAAIDAAAALGVRVGAAAKG